VELFKPPLQHTPPRGPTPVIGPQAAPFACEPVPSLVSAQPR
jgi:hypothetical protein